MIKRDPHLFLTLMLAGTIFSTAAVCQTAVVKTMPGEELVEVVSVPAEDEVEVVSAPTEEIVEVSPETGTAAIVSVPEDEKVVITPKTTATGKVVPHIKAKKKRTRSPQSR